MCHPITCTRQDSLWLKKYGKVIRCLSLFFGTNPLENMKCNQGPHASVNSSCAQPPRATAVHLPALSVLGVGAFANFALPRGWAFANPGAIGELWTRTQFPIRIIIITTQKVLLEKRQIGSPVKDRNKLKRVVKACSRFYAYISSLLYQPRITWRKTGAINVNQCVLVIESNFC